MTLTLGALLSAGSLFVGMLVFLEAGRRLGASRMARDPDGALQGISAVEGAVFALLGLLIAFTFSGAASRFEDRRHLIRAEANAIGTAYLRVDLLPPDAQPKMRELFRRYVDLRIATYHDTSDEMEINRNIRAGAVLQNEIWTSAVQAGRRADAPASTTMLLLPALNEMIDITTTRVVATQNHPPQIIYLMLIGLSLAGALLAGYGMAVGRQRRLLHMVAFAAVISVTLYVILDLEFPRRGLIRVDAADKVLLELRQGMR